MSEQVLTREQQGVVFTNAKPSHLRGFVSFTLFARTTVFGLSVSSCSLRSSSRFTHCRRCVVESGTPDPRIYHLDQVPPVCTLLLRKKVTAWGLLAAIMHAREARQAFVQAGGLEDLEKILVRVRG